MPAHAQRQATPNTQSNIEEGPWGTHSQSHVKHAYYTDAKRLAREGVGGGWVAGRRASHLLVCRWRPALVPPQFTVWTHATLHIWILIGVTNASEAFCEWNLVVVLHWAGEQTSRNTPRSVCNVGQKNRQRP